MATLAREQHRDHQAEQRGGHPSNEPCFGPQRDGEDQTHQKREKVRPGGAPERLQLGELGEQREQIHDDDGRQRGVGDVDDHVGEQVEAENDQQRRDEVVQRRARLCGESQPSRLPQFAARAERESEPAGG